MGSKKWEIHNTSGSKRVIVTKEPPGDRWLNYKGRFKSVTALRRLVG